MPRALWSWPALAALAGLLACHSPAPRPSVTTPPRASHLSLTPLADLVAAGGLRWIVEARPRVLLADPALIEALAGVVSEADLDAQAAARGGVDLRAADAFVAAGYDTTTLFLVHQVVDPARLEAALTAHVADVEGRAIDRSGDDPRDTVVRLWGSVAKEHDALVVFGREALAFSVGNDAPLRAAELFAERRMKRARPVWSTAPLEALAKVLGDAPLRLAAAGPFRGEWKSGVGGLLSEATGAGATLRLDGDTISLRVALTGPWGDRAVDASKRLEATYAALVGSPVGRLLGLDRPVAAPSLRVTADCVELEVRLGLRALVHGIGDATATEVLDLMKR